LRERVEDLADTQATIGEETTLVTRKAIYENHPKTSSLFYFLKAISRAVKNGTIKSEKYVAKQVTPGYQCADESPLRVGSGPYLILSVTAAVFVCADDNRDYS
jgi:hypothetical protein